MATDYLKRMLADEEKILLVARQHWFVFLSSILVELIVTLVIVAIAAIVSTISAVTTIIPLISIVVALVLLLVPFIGGLHDFLVWWNRQYIVTNRRVIQISGIFNKNVTDSSLEKVNDVKMEQTVLGRLFNYGDVEILTASELGVNKFRIIGDPIHFKTAMMNAKARLEQPYTIPPAVTVVEEEPQEEKEDIPAMLEKLDSLRSRGIITEEEFQDKKAKLLAKI